MHAASRITCQAAFLTSVARPAHLGGQCRQAQHSKNTWGSLLCEPCTASWQAASRRLHGVTPSQQAAQHLGPKPHCWHHKPAHAPAARRSSISQASKSSEQSTTKTAVAAVASKSSMSAASPAAATPMTASIPAAVRSVLSPAEIYQQARPRFTGCCMATSGVSTVPLCCLKPTA